MEHHAEFLLTFFSEANMGDTLIIVKVFDLELVDCTTTTSFVKKESDDSSVSESLRRRDVWTVQKSFRFLVTE